MGEYKAKVCGPDDCEMVASTGMDKQTCSDALTREFSVPAVPYCLNEGVRSLREQLERDTQSDTTPATRCPLAQQLGNVCMPSVIGAGSERLISSENVL